MAAVQLHQQPIVCLLVPVGSAARVLRKVDRASKGTFFRALERRYRMAEVLGTKWSACRGSSSAVTAIERGLTWVARAAMIPSAPAPKSDRETVGMFPRPVVRREERLHALAHRHSHLAGHLGAESIVDEPLLGALPHGSDLRPVVILVSEFAELLRAGTDACR